MAKSKTDVESVLKLVIDGNQAKTSLKELRDAHIKLTTEINNMKKADNPQLYREKAEEIQKLEHALKRTREEIKGGSKATLIFKQQLTSLAKEAAGGLLGAGAFYGFINGAKTMIQKNAELSDSIAGVMKTTGLNEEAVDRLNEKFKQMDTRTANTKLLELAQVAGKLGYSAEKDVEGFVKAADKIGVALGEDLGGVEESVNSLGKLVNIFKISDQFELEEALLKVGSAINTLGASGTANEKNLIDFAQRMAGIAPAANITLPEVLALGAVMDELGQSMESSSTAIGQFIVQMGNDIPKFAKIAGMSVDDFSKLLREDANEAFLTVLEKSKTAGGGIQSLATNMGLLEVSGARGIAALGAMADNVDLVRSRMETAKQSFDDGTSIINEFNTANTNLAANLEKIWNNINEFWEHSSLRNWLTDITGALLDNRSEFEKVNDESKRAKQEYEDLESKLSPLIKKYETLTSKGSLNKEENIELRRTITQLSDEWPSAVSEVDKYGNALSINTSILRNNINEHKKYLEIINEKAITEGLLERQKKQNQVDKVKKEIEEKRTIEYTTTTGTGGGMLSLIDRSLSNDELIKKKQLLKELNDELFKIDYELDLKGHNKYDSKAMEAHSKQIINNVDAIEARIAELQKNLDPNKMTVQQFKETEQYLDILTKKRDDLLKKVPKETNTNAGDPKKSTSGKSKAEKDSEDLKRKEETAKNYFQRLLEEEKLFSAQKAINQKAANDKEIAQLELDYQKKIDKFQEFLNMENALETDKSLAKTKITELETERDNQIAALKIKHEKKIAEKIGDIRNELNKKLVSEYDNERNAINEKYDNLIKIVGTNESQIHEIEKARAEDLTNAKIKEEERFVKIKEQLDKESNSKSKNNSQQKVIEIKQRYAEEIALLKQKTNKEVQETEAFQNLIKAMERNMANEIAQIGTQSLAERKDVAIGVAQSISDAVFSIMANNLQAETDARISSIEKQRDKELSNKNLTEKQKKVIQDKYDKQIANEKLRAWKAQKKADILSATINTALAITRALPNLILAGAAGIAGAAQIAVIASQKAPQFATGGFIPRGSSHAQGGIHLIDSRSGSLVGNVEGDEPILSKDTYRNNKELVDSLLYSSQRENGSRIQLRPDLISSEHAIRSSYNQIPANQNVNVSVAPTDNSTIENLLKQLVDKINNPSPVVISNRLLQENNDEISKLQNRVNS